MSSRRDSLCVVTGGAGFIGCALSAGLSERYTRVIAIDNLHPQIHAKQARPKLLDPRVEMLRKDICDPATWDDLLSSATPSVVIHLAAETGTAQSLLESTRHAHTNVVGTTVMLDALSRHGKVPNRIVLSSSRAVYGEGSWKNASSSHPFYPGQRSLSMLNRGQWDFDGVPLPMDAELTRPMPVSVYGATKLAQEHIIECWSKATGAELTVLRLQNVYGPGQSLTNSYTGIVSLFCQLAKKRQSIPLYEDGLVQRDLIHIDDIARAFLMAIDAPASAQPIDIGSGQATTLLELAGHIATMYGAPQPAIVGKFRLGDVRHAFADISHASTAIGWTPRISITTGLNSLAAWIDSNAPVSELS